MNELRVDPLTGLKSIIAAGRASRPGGGFHSEPADRSTPRRTRSSRATRTARRPRCGRCGPAAARPTRPAGSCARCPTSTRAVSPDAEAPAPHPNPDLFTAQAAAGVQEVIVNAPAAR